MSTMSSAPAPRPPLSTNVVALLLLALAVAAPIAERYAPHTFLHGDGAFYALTNRALLEGTLDQQELQPRSWYEGQLGWNRDLDQSWSNVSLGSGGEWYPKHPVLLPLLSTPLYGLAGHTGLLLFNALMTLALLWLAWRFACRWADRWVALGATLLAAALPIFTKSAYAYSNDVLYAGLVLGGLEAFASRRVTLSGALLGLAIWAKPTNVVFGVPLGLWLLAQRRWREAARMAGAAAVPVACVLALNAAMFGSPFTTPYDRILVTEGGEQALASVRDAFNQPVLEGMWRVVGADGGLWEHAHLLLVGLAGALLVLRRAPWAVALLFTWLAGWLVFYGTYDYRYARFFLPLAGVAVAPLAVLLEGAVGLVSRSLAPAPWARVGAIAAASVVALGLGLGLTRGGGPWRAVDAVTDARVTRTAGGREVPCDYFNPNHERWECARKERESWAYWGAALGDRCRMGDAAGDGWLWLHVPRQAAKRIAWSDVPPGDLRIRFGLADRSRYAGVSLRVLDGDEPLAELVTAGPGVVREHLVPASQRRSGRLAIEVPEQPHDWRQLCLDIELHSSPEAPP